MCFGRTPYVEKHVAANVHSRLPKSVREISSSVFSSFEPSSPIHLYATRRASRSKLHARWQIWGSLAEERKRLVRRAAGR
jgi:hypothetical protein